MNAKLLNPAVLSFVGDAVYELFVRERLSTVSRPSGQLHSMSVKLVNAASQAKAYGVIADMLSEDEMSAFKRGRNFHTSNTPKNATKGEYHTATGLECIFGYLHLSNQYSRAAELFEKIWENFTKEL